MVSEYDWEIIFKLLSIIGCKTINNEDAENILNVQISGW